MTEVADKVIDDGAQASLLEHLQPATGKKARKAEKKAAKAAKAAARHKFKMESKKAVKRSFEQFDERRKKLAPPETAKGGMNITADILAKSKQKRRKAFTNWFLAAKPHPGVVPKGQPTLAMDDAITESITWASQALYNNAYWEGTTFLGYAYLSELAQRPEYRRISEVIATEMTRKWIRVKSTGEGKEKGPKIKAINADLERLNARDKFRMLAEQDGFFGRTHLFLQFGPEESIDDRAELRQSVGGGNDARSKLKVGKKNPLNRLQVVEPVWCYPSTYDSADPLKKNWYNPETWFVQGKELHVSRLLTFVGRAVPDLLKPAYSFGGLAMSQMAKPYVDNWLRTRQSVADLISAFNVMILKTDMQATLQAGGNKFYDRVDLFNAVRDNRNTWVIDKNTEDFDQKAVPLGTLDVLQAQTQEHMASVSAIPIVKLLGIQPAGLNATAEGEIRTFYDNIHSFQEKFFRRHLTTVIEFVQLSLFGEVDPEITFDFEPLFALDEKEEAEVQEIEARTDASRIESGVIDAGEARKALVDDPNSRYQGLDPDEVPEPPEQEQGELFPGEEPDDGGEGPGGEGGPDKPPAKPKPSPVKAAGVGKDSVIPFPVGKGVALDSDFKEADHPRDHGKFSSGGGSGAAAETKASPHESKHAKFESHGSANLAKQGFKVRKRGDARDITESAQVAWGHAKETGKPATLYPNSAKGGWAILKPGASIPVGTPHIVVDPDGTVTQYRYKREEEAEPEPKRDRPAKDAARFPVGDAAEFNEADHPRDHGKFATSAGGKGEAAPSGKQGAAKGKEIDPGALKKVGAQMGSNSGGVFEAPGGERFYVKKPKTKDHVRNELLAASLYQLAGSPVLNYRPVAGGEHVATEMRKLEKGNVRDLSAAEREKAKEEFAVHAWLSNYDAAGTGGDNQGVVDGKVTTLDVGGALKYRAQGAPKQWWGKSVGEFDSMRDKKVAPDASGLFGKMTAAELKKSVERVTAIPDEKIREAVKAAGESKEMAETLIARKADLQRRVDQMQSKGDPAAADSVVVFNKGEKAPVKELNGTKFESWKAPTSTAGWKDVDGQVDLGETDVEVPKGKQLSSGVLIREPDGRVWMMRPHAGYGGYEHTFPKGRKEAGLSLQANAIKEAFEETGLKVKIKSVAGDYDGDTTVTRYYMAERETGNPADAHWESSGVVLAPGKEAGSYLNRSRDREIVRKHAMDAQFEEGKHPRDPDGKFTEGSGSGGAAGGKTLDEIAKSLGFKGGWSTDLSDEDKKQIVAQHDAEKAKAEGAAKPSGIGSKLIGKTSAAPYAGLYLTHGGSDKDNHVMTVAKYTDAPAQIGIHYRRMMAKLIEDSKKFGTESAIPKLKEKLGEAYIGTASKLAKQALAATDKAQSNDLLKKSLQASKKAQALGWKPSPGAPVSELDSPTAPGFTPKSVVDPAPAPKPAPKPVTPTLPPAAAATVATAATTKYPVTADDLKKASKTTPIPNPAVSPSGQQMIQWFNNKYQGKPVEGAALNAKVQDYKRTMEAVTKLDAEWQKASQAEKQKAALEQQAAIKAKEEASAKATAAENKHYMDALGITEHEAYGFSALQKMIGGKDFVSTFKKLESEVQQYGYPITGFQAALLKNYTGSGYQSINKALRSGSWSEAQHVYAKMLNKALQGMPTYKGTTKRGTTLTQSAQAAYVVGNVVEERAFTSSSPTKPWSGNTQFTIEAIGQRGAHVKKLSSNPNEDEVVFSARTFFKVTKVTGSPGGAMHVHMTEMPHHD